MAQFHPLTLEYQSNQLLGQAHVCKQPNHQQVLGTTTPKYSPEAERSKLVCSSCHLSPSDARILVPGARAISIFCEP
ncbi:Uncharacterised protein [Vibrio cholerae]|nr:hypothetical protein VCSRO69_3681 [Vibrio cholerae]SNC57694.1 Uncharacterised protein [Vibrio cholerae]